MKILSIIAVYVIGVVAIGASFWFVAAGMQMG
jgi:hypothetical protein